MKSASVVKPMEGTGNWILGGFSGFTGDLSSLTWKPFKPGVEIHRLYGDGVSGGTAAFLRFQPGARIPLHLHQGYEHIFVLEGSQSDGVNTYRTGDLVIHQPGTKHAIISEAGCLVLAIYEKPVAFDETVG